MNDLRYPRRMLSDFNIGQIRDAQFSISSKELSAFITASGDSHPLHTDKKFAKHRNYPNVLLHGMCIASRSSHFLTYEFVGSHGLLVNMTADFRRPAFVNDLLFWHAEVTDIAVYARTIQVKWKVSANNESIIQRGTACAWIPEVCHESCLD